MNEIRAFVAHSFAEDDANVVDKFLKYFDQLAESHPWFKWEHAEPAEPKELAEKVLRVLDGKNVFIGLCTRKEFAIAPGKLKGAFLNKRSWVAPGDMFEWKASDWIIQEIGLARGRNMDLVLLMENGVRKPGDLQGDIEYITFDRAVPEKSFGKILEMIAALSPAPPRVRGTETGPAAASEEEETEKKKEDALDSKWDTPEPGWRRVNYESAYFRAIILEKPEQAIDIDRAYLKTAAGLEPDNADSWQAFCSSTRIQYGSGDLNELRSIVNRVPKNSDCLRYLGDALAYYKQYDEAADVYKSAASNAVDIAARLWHLRRAVEAYLNERKFDTANELLFAMRGISSHANLGEKDVLLAQRKLVELTKDDELLLATQERLITLDPDDADGRFAVAFRYSELGNEAMALFHYSRIPYRDRSDYAWNNLGVAFVQSKLPVNAIDAYREAEEKGNTLAMSNLANRLIEVGFFKEAKEICDRAISSESVHQNVGTTLNRLLVVRDEEGKKEKETIEKAQPISDFYSGLGRASAKSEHAGISGTWIGPDCSLHLAYADSKITCIGEYERPQGMGLLGIVRPPSVLDAPASGDVLRRYRVTYTAKSTGRAFVGSVARKRIDLEPDIVASMLGSHEHSKVLLSLNDSADEMLVMEFSEGREARHYKLTRVSH